MAKPQVMSIDEWLASTDLGTAFLFFRHDRKRLEPIDKALATLSKARAMGAGADPQHEVVCARYVMSACSSWLDRKGTKTTDNAEQRRRAVHKLSKQVLRLLRWHQDPAWRAAWDAFESNKSNKQGGAAAELRELQGAFAREAAKPKGEARMGATMVGKGLNFDGHRSLDEFRLRVERIADTKTDLEELTDAEYQQIEALLFEWKGKQMLDGLGDPMFVVKELVYMNKDERIESMLVPRDHALFTATGGRFSTVQEPRKRMIYAVDEYGNFYAGRGEGGVMNHSSFNRGKGVLCAGEIQARNGVPMFLSNGSGHYKPGTTQLRQAVSRLRDYGIPIDRMLVYDFETKCAFNNGTAFLANRAMVGATPQEVEHRGNPLMG